MLMLIPATASAEEADSIDMTIKDVPKLSAGYFQTNPKDLSFTTPSYDETAYGYYLQIKKGSAGWSTQYGPFAPKSVETIKKLKPNTSYSFRAVYIKKTTQGSETGTVKGPFSKSVTVKTGPSKKPAVKTITAGKAKVKKVYVKPTYDGSGKMVKSGYWTKKTIYKVTVRFKKKPGVKGLYIHASGDSQSFKYVKGNKKVYTAKFTASGNKIGKFTTVKVYTQGNKVYGACSPVCMKITKIKK